MPVIILGVTGLIPRNNFKQDKETQEFSFKGMILIEKYITLFIYINK